MSLVMAGTSSVFTNILTAIESVKSVTANIRIVFSFLIFLSSYSMILPWMVTSPSSPIRSTSFMASSSKSLPKITSGLSDFL